MFISREKALKAYQHISYYSIQRDQFRKKNLIQNQIKIFTKTHQIAHFFKIFSRGSMPHIMCAADTWAPAGGGGQEGALPPPPPGNSKIWVPPRIT